MEATETALTLHEELDRMRVFDPSDANASMELAHAALHLAIRSIRVLWMDRQSMLALGRDDQTYLANAINGVGEKLGFLPSGRSAAESEQWIRRLMASAGLKGEVL